jgi:glycosyltransferase involved in cell wall biosynthesis
MKCYIYKAYIAAGGAFMAYQIGRILHQYFDVDVVVVGNNPIHDRFSYKYNFSTIEKDDFLKKVRKEDLFICNPSHSDELFGLRLPCYSVSYLQGVRTFSVLDVFFDHYVFCSRFLGEYFKTYYSLQAKVINPFINTDIFCSSDDFMERRSVFLVSMSKHQEPVFECLKHTYDRLFPNDPFPIEMIPIVTQEELAAKFKQGRYFISLDRMEGFGLLMLEAMASGCAVVGWDSGGSNDYVVQGENALVSKFGDFEGLAKNIHLVLTNTSLANEIARQGALTGSQFSSKNFDECWCEEITEIFIKREQKMIKNSLLI